MKKIIILDLVTENIIFTQQCFILPITNPIILGGDFLDTHFTVLDVGDCTINLYGTDYMLITSLTHDPVCNKHLENIVSPATTEILYKKIRKKVWKDIPIYIATVQYHSKSLLHLSMQTVLPTSLQSLAVQCNMYFTK